MRITGLCLVFIILVIIIDGTAKDRIEDAGVLLKQIRGNSSIDYDQYVIKGDLNLYSPEEHIIKKPVRFSNSRFNGTLDLGNIEFKDKVVFDNVTFDGDVILTGTCFDKEAEFCSSKFKGNLLCDSGTKFYRYADFSKSVFGGKADFTQAQFNGNVDFGESHFNDAKFERSIFKGYTSFAESSFGNLSTFDYSIFDGIADFAGANFADKTTFLSCSFSQSISFDSCRFIKGAIFDKSKFWKACDFSDTEFGDSVHFKYAFFNKTADFSRANFINDTAFFKSNFIDDAFFTRASFSKFRTDFSGSQFKGYVNYDRSQFNGTADFSDSLFAKDAYFDKCTFYKDASFESAKFNAGAFFEDCQFKESLNLIKTEYNKFYIRLDNINNLKYNETAYKSLIENFKKMGFFDDAYRCYYQFMKAYACEKLPGFGIIGGLNDKIVAWEKASKVDSLSGIGSIFVSIYFLLSWVLYGFGTKPDYTLAWSLFLILIVFGPFWYYVRQSQPKDTCYDEYSWIEYQDTSHQELGLKTKLSTVVDALLFSATIFLSGTKFFIDPPKIPESLEKSSPWVNRMYTLERFLGGTFSLLFFVAIGSIIFSM